MELDEIQKAVGKQMKKARVNAGLSLLQLNNKTKLGKAHISHCEAGRKNLTLNTIRRFSVGCGVPAKFFFEWE